MGPRVECLVCADLSGNLVVSGPLAGWFLIKRDNSDKQKWPAFFVIFLYSANFGNVLGICVVHTMEGWRYFAVQFIAAIFAQIWAIRWLLEIALTELQRRLAGFATGGNRVKPYHYSLKSPSCLCNSIRLPPAS